MAVFSKYAHYYDLFYHDKDYKAETRYVDTLIRKYYPEAKNILELGCGTGRHAEFLNKKGYEICGLDVSSEMIEQAQRRAGKARHKNAAMTFIKSDIRDFALPKTYDVIISLFHVVSYQKSNEDLKAVFTKTKEHLTPKGIFIFDCWYGPAVLTERPTVKVKRYENEDIVATRIAEPVMLPNKNRVNVNYQIFIRDKKNGAVEEISETHKMRYLFKPELDAFLSEIGLEIIHSEEWLTGRSPGFNTWNVCFVGQG